MYGRMACFRRDVRCRVADFLGLIGRNWLMCLGWVLFAMAISEPVKAVGQDACAGRSGAMAECESAIAASYAYDCTAGGASCACRYAASTTTESYHRYRVDLMHTIPGIPEYSLAQFFGNCPLCSSYGPVTPPAGSTGWPGPMTQTVCISGCDYLPSEGAYAEVTVDLIGAAGGDASGTSGTVTSLEPTGTSCPSSGQVEVGAVDDLPEPSQVCAQIETTHGPSPVCISADAECDGYVGEFMGERICVPKIQPTPCTGPYCENADPPGDADNDEDNADTPEMEINVVYPHDLNQNSTDDTDFFTPQAGFPGGNGCAPCPYAGDPDDPRDPDEPPPPDMDGDGIPDATDDDIDGDGKGNGEDDDTDGDGTPNGTDDDIDGDGTPNGDDDDDDGDGQSGSGSDGNGVDPDDNADGTPDGVPEGDPDGECDPQTGEGCGDGEASGGASCKAPPTCTGDPVTCMVAHQAWETRCAVNSLEDRIFDTDGADDSTGTEGIEADDVVEVIGGDSGAITLDESGFLGGSYGGECPNLTFEVMGRTISPDSDGKFCAALNFIPILTLIVAAWLSANIIAGGTA